MFTDISETNPLVVHSVTNDSTQMVSAPISVLEGGAYDTGSVEMAMVNQNGWSGPTGSWNSHRESASRSQMDKAQIPTKAAEVERESFCRWLTRCDTEKVPVFAFIGVASFGLFSAMFAETKLLGLELRFLSIVALILADLSLLAAIYLIYKRGSMERMHMVALQGYASQNERFKENIGRLEKERLELSQNISCLQGERVKLSQEVSELQTLSTDLNKSLNLANSEISGLEDVRKTLDDRVGTLKTRLDRFAKLQGWMEKSGQKMQDGVETVLQELVGNINKSEKIQKETIKRQQTMRLDGLVALLCQLEYRDGHEGFSKRDFYELSRRIPDELQEYWRAAVGGWNQLIQKNRSRSRSRASIWGTGKSGGYQQLQKGALPEAATPASKNEKIPYSYLIEAVKDTFQNWLQDHSCVTPSPRSRLHSIGGNNRSRSSAPVRPTSLHFPKPASQVTSSVTSAKTAPILSGSARKSAETAPVLASSVIMPAGPSGYNFSNVVAPSDTMHVANVAPYGQLSPPMRDSNNGGRRVHFQNNAAFPDEQKMG